MSQVTAPVTPADFAPPAIIGRMGSRSLVIGAAAMVALVIGGFVWGWDLFLRAWLYSFWFWLGLTLGSLTLLMLQYVTGGNWGRLGRRIWEAGASNLWLVFLFWLPVAFGMKHLFAWTTWSRETAVQELGQKAVYYLTPGLFWFRGFIYFVGWSALYIFLKRWSIKEEEGRTTPAQFVTVQNVCGAGIVFYAFTITFASIDWAMSLDPKWWSTVWGMIFMVSEVLTAFCFTIWLLVKLAPMEPLSRMFKVDYLHDFGKLMFTFVILWAYTSFSQWLIIWSGNLLSEIRWYLIRLNGGWQFFGMSLIFIHFAFPFALLLSRSLKRNGPRIVKIALLLMIMRLVDLFWFTAPNFYPEGKLSLMGASGAAMYILAPIAMGGLWLFFFYLQLGKRSLMPVRDPHFMEMLEAKHG